MGLGFQKRSKNRWNKEQEKEELTTEVEDLKKHIQQLKQELCVLKDLPQVGLGQQKVKIPANELTRMLISRAMRMREKYLELPVENGIAKLPGTKVQTDPLVKANLRAER